MFRIENLHNRKRHSQEVLSTVFHWTSMMWCHQHKKTECARTKIRNYWFCWVGWHDTKPSPPLISPWVGILARTRTYVLPSQACVNKSVTTMNGFRSYACLCIFCLKKYSKYVKTCCNLGLDNKLYITLSQSWWTTEITIMSFLRNCLVSYLRSITGIATSLRLTTCITRQQIIGDKNCKERNLILCEVQKREQFSRFHSNTYRSHMISKHAFCNSLVHAGSRRSTYSNTLTLVCERDWTNSCRIEPLWSLTTLYTQRM